MSRLVVFLAFVDQRLGPPKYHGSLGLGISNGPSEICFSDGSSIQGKCDHDREKCSSENWSIGVFFFGNHPLLWP